MPNALRVLLIILFFSGMIVVVSLIVSHPGTGSVICNPAVCVANPNYTPPSPSSPGSPSAAPEFTAPSEPPDTGPDAWWLTVNACRLLTVSQVSSLDLTEPPYAADSPQAGCTWGGVPYEISITLSDSAYTQEKGDHARPFRADDGRPGETGVVNSLGCEVTLQATKGSTAYILVMSSPSDQCQIAARVANWVSPELPRSGITR